MLFFEIFTLTLAQFQLPKLDKMDKTLTLDSLEAIFYGIKPRAGLELGWLTWSRVFLFISTPKAVSHKGEGNMLAWAHYHGFHVANILSDPPSPQSLMETEAQRLEPSPPTWSHPTRNKVYVRDKGAASPSLETEGCRTSCSCQSSGSKYWIKCNYNKAALVRAESASMFREVG